jgi:hypothetical protein
LKNSARLFSKPNRISSGRRLAVKYNANISGLKLLEHYLGMDIKKVKWYISQGRGSQLIRIVGLLNLRYIKERNRYVEKMSYIAERKLLSKKKQKIRKNPKRICEEGMKGYGV